MRDNLAPPFFVIPLGAFRPYDHTWRNRVDAHIRRQFLRQRARERGQPTLGHAVQQMAVHGTLGMDVHDIDDGTMVAAQLCCCRLRQQQRGFEVGADQVIPALLVNLFQWRGIKAGGVVD